MPTNAVANSSNILIKKGLKKVIKHQFPEERLIGPRNKYKIDTVNTIDSYNNSTAVPFALTSNEKSHLAQYMASSTISHCFDGWNFVSRGVESLLNGDIASCIHFVYYAELRAVMALLACDGIGIFNKKHIYFDASEAEFLFNKYRPTPTTQRNIGTHLAADVLMNLWVDIPQKKDIIFNTVIANNRSLADWIIASGHSTTGPILSLMVKDWFENWSIDLKLHKDQMLRNEMSYRPHFEIENVDINSLMDKLTQIWIGLEPTPSNRFPDLDRHLLRKSIEYIFQTATGKRKLDTLDGRRFLENVFGNLGESKEQPLWDFLLRKTNPKDHILLELARLDKGKAHINIKDPLPMFCRSILLLRFATGYTNQVMNDCLSDLSKLSFWWEDVALKMGIINTKPSEIQTCDLYADISEAIVTLRDGPRFNNIMDTFGQFSTELNNLKQFQRTCFWGLGL